MSTIVSNKNTLKAMAKAGFIEWQEGYTTRHWTGVEVPVIFVRPGPKLKEWHGTGPGWRSRSFSFGPGRS